MRILTFTFLLCFCLLNIHAQVSNMTHIASYETNAEGNAEVVTYDAERKAAYITSSENNSFSIIDVSDATNPQLVKEVDLSSYGAGPNSIATNGSLIAVAVENENKQENGSVIFFDMDGTFQQSVEAGALPDMLIFNPAGDLVLVANEGEPSSDYLVDPHGSLTIIDLDYNAVTYDFTEFNDRKQSLINRGVRIFGGDGASSVAQDLEPEFITLNEEGSIAYINCQENNALALFDLANRRFIDILPLGYKDHRIGTPSIESFKINELVQNWPELGTPVYDGGQDAVMLGGFSGMWFSENESTESKLTFYAIPDRGPNASPVKKANTNPASSQNLRPFKLPNYQARVAKFTVEPLSGNVELVEQILLTRNDGTTAITGKGNIPGFDEVPVTYTDANTDYSNVDFTDNNGEEYHLLSYDEYGGDFEGILIDKNNTFWMCDEYRPAIYHFNLDGTLIERYVAEGTSQLGDNPVEVGTYGAETLPSVYSKRRANRGFEAIAYDEENEIIYAFIQSPMYNRDSNTKNKSDVIRILGISADPNNEGVPVAEYVYLLDRNAHSGFSASRVDKIGDAVYTGNGKFLVVERDSEGPDNPLGQKFIFEIDLLGATNILGTSFSESDDFFLEENSADMIADLGIQAVHKRKVLNLPSIGYVSSDKVEGISLLSDGSIAVLNDNDFGLAGAGITDNSVLGIITFDDDYSFDASNKDDSINITNHPTLGMYQPDAIASYTVDGITYIVTANEGDARDYDGYSEETRVKKLDLNTERYPDADLQTDENLGRLKTTTAHADFDNDGLIDQIYSYGARSFSIFDQYGNLVFDSGNVFGKKIAENEPDLFNEDDGDFDDRSDDKGGEPEAIAIGDINDRKIAFIGLERQSAIIAYDITNPREPEFLDYYNNRIWENGEVTGDVSPEIIKFIDATDSPTSEPMLLVGYEVSGSMALISVANIVSTIETNSKAKFNVYPNPISNQQTLNFSEEITGSIFNVNGKLMKHFESLQSVDISDFEKGLYIIKSEKGSRKFLVL